MGKVFSDLRRRLYLSEIKGQFVLTPPIYGWPLCQQGPWWHLSSGVSWTDWIYHHCQALHFDLCQIERNNITIFWTHYPFNNPNFRLWFISCCVTSLNHQSKFKILPNLISSMILITCLWLGQIWVTWYEVLPSHAEISDILPPIGLPRSCLPLDANAQLKAWHYGVPSPQWKCEKCDCGHYNVIHMLGILGCMWSRCRFV